MGQKEEIEPTKPNQNIYNQTDRQNRQNRQGQVQEETERGDTKNGNGEDRRWQNRDATRFIARRAGDPSSE